MYFFPVGPAHGFYSLYISTWLNPLKDEGRKKKKKKEQFTSGKWPQLSSLQNLLFVTQAKKIIKTFSKNNNLVMARNSTTSKSIFSSNGLQAYDDFTGLELTLLIVYSSPKVSSA